MTWTDKHVTVPARLRPGARVRVVAPSCSRSYVMEHDNTRWINERFAALGIKLSFGRHVDERDDFDSSSITSRLEDLHAAFADPTVDGIMSVIGGFNANELLPYLDWDLIAANPKVFCGYSDFTVLANAIHARTGMITYVGPHWSMFGMRDHFEPTGQWFTAATSGQAWSIEPATAYTDDLWFMNQDGRQTLPTEGPWVLREGAGTGRVIGGNLCTLNLLQGTGLMPRLEGAMLFLEDDAAGDIHEFARNLAALLQRPDAAGITGLGIGRFQQDSGVTRSMLRQVVDKHPLLDSVPVVANLDFGHTSPMFTLPIGGQARLAATPAQGQPDRVQLRFAHRREQLDQAVGSAENC